MSYALQCCVRCGALEHGHTGPADRYVCADCYGAGWRVNAGGNLSQVEIGSIRCLRCGLNFHIAPDDWTCPACAGPVSQHAGTIVVAPERPERKEEG